MANLRAKLTVRNAQLNLLRDALDAGGAAGTMKIYSGAQPATPETAIGAQVLLATLTLSYPCAPNASAAALTFSPIAQDNSADVDGFASFARFEDSNGNAVLDADVGESNATVIINSASILAGGPVRCDSAVISLGG